MDDKIIKKIVDNSHLGRKLAVSILGAIDNKYSPELQQIKTLVEDIDKRLVRLENYLDSKYMKSFDYQNFVYKTLRQASSDLRQEKIFLFANLIVNSALKDRASEKDRWKYLYGEAIDKIDEDLFSFLLIVKTRCITKGKELGLGWIGNEKELFLKGLDQTTFRTNADYLMSTGLMTRIHQLRHNPEKESVKFQDEYYVTEFGSAFIEYVREYDASVEANAEVVE